MQRGEWLRSSHCHTQLVRPGDLFAAVQTLTGLRITAEWPASLPHPRGRLVELARHRSPENPQKHDERVDQSSMLRRRGIMSAPVRCRHEYHFVCGPVRCLRVPFRSVQSCGVPRPSPERLLHADRLMHVFRTIHLVGVLHECSPDRGHRKPALRAGTFGCVLPGLEHSGNPLPSAN